VAEALIAGDPEIDIEAFGFTLRDISNSLDQIELLYTQMKDENIVKGWAPA